MPRTLRFLTALFAASFAALASANELPACVRAADEVLSNVSGEKLVSHSWPFAPGSLENLSEEMRALQPKTEFSTFVMKSTGGKRPNNILLDAASSWPTQPISEINLHGILEQWGRLNQEKFVKLANLFQCDPKDLVAAYFKQGSANIDQFTEALTQNAALIPRIVEEFNKVPHNTSDPMTIKKFVANFLKNPTYLKPEYSLPEMNDAIYEINRAVNNLGFSAEEFSKRLNRQKISFAEFKKLFWIERNRHGEPGKFSQIMKSLETRFQDLRRVAKFETLRDSPQEFVEFTRRLYQDGADQTLIWMSNLHPSQIARIYKTMRRDLAQKFVTNPELIKTAMSLTILDTIVFGATQMLKYGELNSSFGWTLASIIASEIPLTFASVSKMAYVAAKEFPGSRTLAESALHNAPLRLNNALPKTGRFLLNLGRDVKRDAGTLFAYSTVMTAATQLAAEATGFRDDDEISPMGATFEVAVWFALIANIRYKIVIGRIQTPLSASKYFLAHPKQNFLMVNGLTTANILTGNALWVFVYSPWFHRMWNEEIEGKTPPPAENLPTLDDAKPKSEALKAAYELDKFEDYVRTENPDLGRLTVSEPVPK